MIPTNVFSPPHHDQTPDPVPTHQLFGLSKGLVMGNDNNILFHPQFHKHKLSIQVTEFKQSIYDKKNGEMGQRPYQNSVEKYPGVLNPL
jgi:hypothetical protein